MISPRRLGPAGVLRFLSICGLCSLPLPSSAQAAELNLTGASNCTLADFNAHVQFLNGPGAYFAVLIDKRNISNHSCVFDGPMYGPSFVPDRVPDNPPFALCYDCENRLPNGQFPPIPPLAIKPGQVARQIFRWRTKPPDETVRCLQPKWMSGPILIVAPALLKNVCSDIEVSRFSLAPSPDSASTKDPAVDDDRIPGFELTSDRSKYYEGERFSVRVSLVQPGAGAPTSEETSEESCPTLYLWQRSPDGATRIDEVQPLAFKGCRTHVLGHQPGDWQSGFELDSGANARWSGAGEHALEVLQSVDSPDNAPIRFASSNVLRIEIADPSAIPRKWGPHVNGVAADITLDKDTFRIGEDVPLHMAVENFDAAVPVYAWDALWDPCEVVSLEVHDASGRPLPANERFPAWSICTGHGFGPRPYAKGKVVPLERTLGAEGWLPNHAGTYTVVVTWAPCAGPNATNNAPAADVPADLKPYAVVHATATIHVSGNVAGSGASPSP